jgi:hypothetical protein
MDENKKTNDKENKNVEAAKKKRRFTRKKARFLLLLIMIAVVAAAVVYLMFFIGSNKGMRKAQKLAKKIGESSVKIGYRDDGYITSSDFEFLNDLIDFSVINEAPRKTDIYGVSVPEWVIYCGEDSYGNLESVTYYDFRVLEDNINGVRKSSHIDTSKITTGMTMSEVDEILDMTPYQTFYSGNTTVKKYKYYYRDKQSDVIGAYYITVIFSMEKHLVNAPVMEEENDFIYDILKVDND